MFNRKSALHYAFATLIVLGTLAAGSARAGNVQWSVSVSLPPLATVVSNVPVYTVPTPVYHAPMAVPVPVVVYRPAPPPVAVYRPVPVVDHRGWEHRHRHNRHHHHRHDRRDDRGGERWESGPRQRHH